MHHPRVMLIIHMLMPDNFIYWCKQIEKKIEQTENFQWHKKIQRSELEKKFREVIRKDSFWKHYYLSFAGAVFACA